MQVIQSLNQAQTLLLREERSNGCTSELEASDRYFARKFPIVLSTPTISANKSIMIIGANEATDETLMSSPRQCPYFEML